MNTLAQAALYFFLWKYMCSSLVNGILRALQATQAIPNLLIVQQAHNPK
jgi:hypothetical protein